MNSWDCVPEPGNFSIHDMDLDSNTMAMEKSVRLEDCADIDHLVSVECRYCIIEFGRLFLALMDLQRGDCEDSSMKSSKRTLETIDDQSHMRIEEFYELGGHAVGRISKNKTATLIAYN